MNEVGGIFHKANLHYQSDESKTAAYERLQRMRKSRRIATFNNSIQQSITNASKPMNAAINGGTLSLTPTQHSIIDPISKIADFLIKTAKKFHKL